MKEAGLYIAEAAISSGSRTHSENRSLTVISVEADRPLLLSAMVDKSESSSSSVPPNSDSKDKLYSSDQTTLSSNDLKSFSSLNNNESCEFCSAQTPHSNEPWCPIHSAMLPGIRKEPRDIGGAVYDDSLVELIDRKLGQVLLIQLEELVRDYEKIVNSPGQKEDKFEVISITGKKKRVAWRNDILISTECSDDLGESDSDTVRSNDTNISFDSLDDDDDDGDISNDEDNGDESASQDDGPSVAIPRVKQLAAAERFGSLDSDGEVFASDYDGGCVERLSRSMDAAALFPSPRGSFSTDSETPQSDKRLLRSEVSSNSSCLQLPSCSSLVTGGRTLSDSAYSSVSPNYNIKCTSESGGHDSDHSPSDLTTPTNPPQFYSSSAPTESPLLLSYATLPSDRRVRQPDPQAQLWYMRKECGSKSALDSLFTSSMSNATSSAMSSSFTLPGSQNSSKSRISPRRLEDSWYSCGSLDRRVRQHGARIHNRLEYTKTVSPISISSQIKSSEFHPSKPFSSILPAASLHSEHLKFQTTSTSRSQTSSPTSVNNLFKETHAPRPSPLSNTTPARESSPPSKPRGVPLRSGQSLDLSLRTGQSLDLPVTPALESGGPSRPGRAHRVSLAKRLTLEHVLPSKRKGNYLPASAIASSSA